MAVMVHVGNRSFVVNDAVDTDQLAQDITDAVQNKTSFTFEANLGDVMIVVFVNAAQVDVVIFDPSGVGAGFFHV